MKSIQSIRSRIEGIKSTKQITNSMRLVSSSKVQKSRVYADNNQSFFEEYNKLINTIAYNGIREKNPYFIPREISSTAIIIISTDRGLCGGYNMNIARTAIQLSQKKENTKIITVGSKISESLSRIGIAVDLKLMGLYETPLFEEACMISDKIIELYDSKKIDEVYVVYTDFISILEQKATSVRLLPFETDQHDTFSREWEFEPKLSSLLKTIVPEYLCSSIYHFMTQSAVSEQSARVTSMDAAARNSDEIIAGLTLKYNQARQGNITQEITEIISGANAIE